MPHSTAATVDEYLEALPDDRRAALTAVRDVINANLPKGYVEGMLYGFPTWYVPLERYGDTYNGLPISPFALGSQKQYMALYLVSAYMDPKLDKWFRAAYAKSGHKLDMGKGCVRFKTLDKLPLDVVGEAVRKLSVAQFIACYEAAQQKRAKPAKKKPAAKPKKKR